MIVNTCTGVSIPVNPSVCRDILTKREKQILKMINMGEISKEIAEKLSISLHTVNRHRQNILEKLNVTNSIEACRVAAAIGLF